MEQLESIITSPRISITERMMATKRIEEQINACEGTLMKLDAVVELVKKTNPDFYEQYQLTRKVLQLQGSSLTLRGSAVDGSNNQGIKGVTVVFTPEVAEVQDALTGRAISKPSLVKTTAEKGNFNVKQLPAGRYSVIATKAGYATLQTSVSVADGELTALDIVMTRS